MKNQITKIEDVVHGPHRIFKGNREEWLNKVADFVYDKISEEFVPAVGRDKIKLSLSFMPTGAGANAIGVCLYEGSSEGDFREIFIKPTLGANDLASAIETAQVVAHEVTHAICPKGTGHGPKFKKIIIDYLGATGKPTATVAGPEFTLWIKDFILELGLLDHAPIKDTSGQTGGTTCSLKCTNDECIGGSDKSRADGFGLISRISIASARKVGDNFRCSACGSYAVVELPKSLRDDYK